MIFKPEDFILSYNCHLDKHDKSEIAVLANAALKEWLDAAPLVYGVAAADGQVLSFMKQKGPAFTHQARLVCIEEIVKAPCKHAPLDVAVQIGPYTKSVTFDYSSDSKCKHCGVELVAEWREKK